MLRTLFLTLDNDAGRQVRNADRRVGLVDVLSTGAGGAERVDVQFRRIDLNRFDLLGFRQHRDRARRGMDTALGLGGGHTLYAVRAGLEFEPPNKRLLPRHGR